MCSARGDKGLLSTDLAQTSAPTIGSWQGVCITPKLEPHSSKHGPCQWLEQMYHNLSLPAQACAAQPSCKPEAVAKRAGGALTAAAALWASVALTAGAADLSAGEEVFANNCAACHTGGANVVQAEKTLAKDALVAVPGRRLQA